MQEMGPGTYIIISIFCFYLTFPSNDFLDSIAVSIPACHDRCRCEHMDHAEQNAGDLGSIPSRGALVFFLFLRTIVMKFVIQLCSFFVVIYFFQQSKARRQRLQVDTSYRSPSSVCYNYKRGATLL